MDKPAPPFAVVETGFAGLRLLQPRAFEDLRGHLVKTFHAGFFKELVSSFEPREEFYSVSAKNVLRGMHFQSPPAAHAKLAYCLGGRVLDVALDLRRAQPTFGQCYSRELSAANREMLFMPAGFAHGFLALEDQSLMVYKTDVIQTPDCERGVAWDSFGFPWPVVAPVMSERDRRLPCWSDFSSPF